MSEPSASAAASSLEENAGCLLTQLKHNSIKDATTIDQLETLVNAMKTQLGGVTALLKQNAAMEDVITELSAELEEATTGILKRGHLYKWRDHSISFASKWGQRYITLQGHILSYFNDEKDRHPRRTIDLRTCFILNEGLTKNKQHHIFSICSTTLNEDNRGPHSGALLRLSSNNAAEAMQWINLLEKACGFSTPSSVKDTDSSSSSSSGNAPSNPVLTRVQSSEAILKSLSKRSKSSSSLLSSPNIINHVTKQGERHLSSHQEVIKKLKKKVHVTSFPASKNMHTGSKASPLSSSATKQNYRGFFNLGVIILLISHFRLITDNLMDHGFRFSIFFDSSVEGEGSYWDAPRPLVVFLSWLVVVGLTFGVEKMAQHCFLSDRVTMVVQGFMSFANITGSALWVWHSNSHSGLSMLYLLQSVVLWMKLISYAHCNRDLRIALKNKEIMQNTSPNTAVATHNVHAEIQDLEGPVLVFPHNLTPSNLMYFCVAPTLCYQLNYPRSPKVRWTIVVSIIVRLAIVLALIFYVIEQHMKPSLEAAMVPMKQLDVTAVLFGLLQLMIPSTYVWLLVFYLFFHLWLNLLAELTRFSDREFYLDWWNARTIDEYWRTWNLPVHHWMIRHLYYPALRLGISKTYAVYLSFFFSAVMHEFIISIPFRRISFHAFLGMLFQAPLVPVTRKLNALFNNPSIGNIFFWLSFCIIGQPIGVVMYYYEAWAASCEMNADAVVEL